MANIFLDIEAKYVQGEIVGCDERTDWSLNVNTNLHLLGLSNLLLTQPGELCLNGSIVIVKV